MRCSGRAFSPDRPAACGCAPDCGSARARAADTTQRIEPRNKLRPLWIAAARTTQEIDPLPGHAGLDEAGADRRLHAKTVDFVQLPPPLGVWTSIADDQCAIVHHKPAWMDVAVQVDARLQGQRNIPGRFDWAAIAFSDNPWVSRHRSFLVCNSTPQLPDRAP